MIYKHIHSTFFLTILWLLVVHSVLAVDAGSLNGEYITVGYYHDPWSYLATLTFDGNGSVTYKHIATSDNNNESGTETYSVASDGRFKVANAEGVVSSDGNVIAFGDFNANDPGVSVAIKTSSGKSNASLNGEYVGIGYFSDLWSNLVSLTFDGNGNVTYTDIETSDNNNQSGTETYNVSSNGRFSIAGTGMGIITPDADVIAWVDTDGNNIGFYIAIKKASSTASSSGSQDDGNDDSSSEDDDGGCFISRLFKLNHRP